MRTRLRVAALALGLSLQVSLAGCATIHDDMRIARERYSEAAYEDALVWLLAVEPDVPGEGRGLQARWHYLRGMTAFRMGHLDDARHYLALAHVIAGERGVGLPPGWNRTLDLTLAELRIRTPRE